MSLLKKDQLQKSAGLLNSSAPEDHFLAYITADERDMLVDAGGKETPTASGIFSYQPPGDASAAESRAYHTPSERGPPGGGSGGPSGDMYYKAPPRSVVHDTGAISETSDIAKHYKDYQEFLEYDRTGKGEKPKSYFVGNRSKNFNEYLKGVDYQPPEKSVAQKWFEQYGDPDPVTETVPGDDLTNLKIERDWGDDPETERKKIEEFEKTLSGKGDVKYNTILDFYKQGGFIGEGLRAAKDFIEPLSKGVQKRLMTWGLNQKLKSIQKKSDFHPGAYGYKINNIQKDLQGVKDGTFTQSDYTEKYGSGDVGADRPGPGEDFKQNLNQRDPGDPGDSTPRDSQAAKWFANQNYSNNTFNFSFQNEYNAAKARQASILGNPSPMKYLAVNQSPYYDFLKKNKLDRGIL